MAYAPLLYTYTRINIIKIDPIIEQSRRVVVALEDMDRAVSVIYVGLFEIGLSPSPFYLLLFVFVVVRCRLCCSRRRCRRRRVLSRTPSPKHGLTNASIFVSVTVLFLLFSLISERCIWVSCR